METTFAAPSRADPERFRYARACLSQGLTYPAAARAAGVNEQDLRGRVEGFSVNRMAPQAAARSPLEQCAGILSSASPEECGQVAAVALALLADLSGPNAARIAVANIMTSLPSLAAHTPAPMTRVVARDVADYVAAGHGLTFDQLRSVLRTRAFARPRQIAMYAIKRLCPHMSYPGIGRLLGNRDHSTILSGERKIAELIRTDPDVAASVADVLARFAPQAMRDAA